MAWVKITDPEEIKRVDKHVIMHNKINSELNSNHDYEPYVAPESQGWSGVGEDAINKLIGGVLGIPSMIGNSPEIIRNAFNKTEAGLEQIGDDPKRAGLNLLAGSGEFGHKLLGIPGETRDYLQRKGIVSKDAPSFRLPESILPRKFNYGEGVGLEGEQEGDSFMRGIPEALATAGLGKLATPLLEAGAPIAKAVSDKLPKISNKSFAKKLSADKAAISKEASAGYNQLFNDVRKELDIDRVKVPKINSANIIKNSQPKHHEALKKFLSEPTFENAHWAQSDLGFIERHLKKIDEKGGLSSQQHKVLKETMAARNRIKEAMFENKKLADNDVFKGVYNKLNEDYAKNVVPYKQLQELSEFENKKLTSKNLINSLLKDDEFLLGLGKKYPVSMAAQKIKRSPSTKLVGSAIAADLGYHKYKGY